MKENFIQTEADPQCSAHGENILTREQQFLVCLFTILGAGTSTQA